MSDYVKIKRIEQRIRILEKRGKKISRRIKRIEKSYFDKNYKIKNNYPPWERNPNELVRKNVDKMIGNLNKISRLRSRLKELKLKGSKNV